MFLNNISLLVLLCAFGVAAQAQQVVISGEITQNRTLSADSTYLLRGYVYVKNNATLTIEPGTVIMGERATKGTLIITRNGYIQAEGTAEQPIVFTSDQPQGQRTTGDWGGVVILGSAPTNCTNNECQIEGGLNNANGDGLYGGPDADDSSGVFRYVRIDWAGIAVQPDNEVNSLTLGGVGRRTVVDHVQASFGGDDSFEFFGGTVNASHLVSYAATDDDFDTDFGWQGAVQFGLAIRYPNRYDVSLSNGFESDNLKLGTATTPLTAGVFSNMTLVGPLVPGVDTANALFQAALDLRRATSLRVFNSLFIGWPKGLLIEGNASETHALSGQLRVAYNVFSNCDQTYQFDPKGGTTTINMNQWASANGNDSLPVASLGLNSPIDILTPDFTLTGISPLISGGYFTDSVVSRYSYFLNTAVTHRGAFGTEDWTTCWTNWTPQFNSPQNPVPCQATAINPEAAPNAAAAFTLSPNPATSQQVTLQLGTATTGTVQVLDATGRLVLSQNLQADSASLDVAPLPTGLYLVQVQTTTGATAVQKLLKP